MYTDLEGGGVVLVSLRALDEGSSRTRLPTPLPTRLDCLPLGWTSLLVGLPALQAAACHGLMGSHI